MTSSHFLAILDDKCQDFSLRIMLPNGELIPEHFHISEIGKVDKTFVDVSNTQREVHICVLKVWVGHDVEYRLIKSKLNALLSRARSIYADNSPMAIEYGNETAREPIIQYSVRDVEIMDDGDFLIVLGF